jgi:hypothetical protein
MTNKTKNKLEAIVEHDGDEKYILAKVGAKKVLVSMPLKYHSEIAREYANMVDEKVRILGGGIMTIDRDAKVIKTYGMSGSYGKPDAKDVEAILAANFEGYKIDAKVTDYIRG